MAQVLLLSAAPFDDPERPYAHDELKRMRLSAEQDKFGVHSLTDDPARADLILFVENGVVTRHYSEVREHPYVQDYREKCFLYTDADHAIPFLPGIYTSIEKRWYSQQRTRSGPYLRSFTIDFITYDPSPIEREYLFSFLGAINNHPVRQAIAELEADGQYVFDTTPYWPYGELDEEERKRLEQHYVESCRKSKFILCPRGRGVSSYRLFESLRLGRPPVIISDQWVPPEGPDWETFSVRVAEEDVACLPTLLAEHEDQAVEMGERARQTWEDWFSKEATFHRTVEWCLDIKRERALPEAVLRFSVLPQLLRPLHLKFLIKKAFFGMPKWQ